MNTVKARKLVKRGPESNHGIILKLWSGDEELQFNEVVKNAKMKQDISRRTAINYLNRLVDSKHLERRVDDKRRTFYKISTKGEERKLKMAITDKFDEYWESLTSEERKIRGFVLEKEILDLLEIKALEDNIVMDLLNPETSEKLGCIMSSLTADDMVAFYKSWLLHYKLTKKTIKS
ncbi:hypothetical protein ISS39_08090 [Candidatus Bathyarchaeota archaeon]|nr:hypothetical protein [Candidatus Bathyarchaeota archaeon]